MDAARRQDANSDCWNTSVVGGYIYPNDIRLAALKCEKIVAQRQDRLMSLLLKTALVPCLKELPGNIFTLYSSWAKTCSARCHHGKSHYWCSKEHLRTLNPRSKSSSHTGFSEFNDRPLDSMSSRIGGIHDIKRSEKWEISLANQDFGVDSLAEEPGGEGMPLLIYRWLFGRFPWQPPL